MNGMMVIGGEDVMEYMVILIYVVVMMQFINSKPLVKERSKCRGYYISRIIL